MKAMTVVIYFEEGQQPERVTIGEDYMGGKITGMAAYDMMHTMEIAERAIENSNEDQCVQAVEEIDKYICTGV